MKCFRKQLNYPTLIIVMVKKIDLITITKTYHKIYKYLLYTN